MKIVFASDISFGFLGDRKICYKSAMQEPANVFKDADFSMVNLENVFGDEKDGEAIVKSGPNLISSDDCIECIEALNPTVVGLANNHTNDYGENIMFHTMDMLKARNYQVIGAGKDIDQAYKPAYLEKDGIKVGVLAVCENEFGGASDTKSGTAGYNLTRVTKGIRGIIKNQAKPVIYFHGGNESNPFPSPGKVELYRHFIDLGAEAVIAMHTHCPQGYEIYDGKPIVYSMGNFFFPIETPWSVSWSYGYMSMLDVSRDGVKFEPVSYKFDMQGIKILSGGEKEHFEKYLGVISEPIKNPEKLQNLFDSWCLTQGYFSLLSGYRDDLFSDGKTEEIKHIKNVFCCEAHNELVKNTVSMIYENRVEKARAGVQVIEKLKRLEID